MTKMQLSRHMTRAIPSLPRALRGYTIARICVTDRQDRGSGSRNCGLRNGCAFETLLPSRRAGAATNEHA